MTVAGCFGGSRQRSGRELKIECSWMNTSTAHIERCVTRNSRFREGSRQRTHSKGKKLGCRRVRELDDNMTVTQPATSMIFESAERRLVDICGAIEKTPCCRTTHTSFYTRLYASRATHLQQAQYAYAHFRLAATRNRGEVRRCRITNPADELC